MDEKHIYERHCISSCLQGTSRRGRVKEDLMITMCLLHISLVMLFSTEISSLDCTILLFQQNKMNTESLELLSKIGGQFPLRCLKENRNFRLPQKALRPRESQEKDAKMVIQEILQQILNIFSENLTQAAWDRSSVETLQNGLHWQTEKLETCLHSEMENETPYLGNKKLLFPMLKLKKYFQRIRDFLKEKQFSLCAWETIRLEMGRCLLFVDQLIKKA
ncbi:interferon epsilon-like [Gopherus evgoodei]|uniref:interferon epsilon-like n=1 Tax=Gopherus evgoodei TaxID=1825980 RepID=UPI0011CF707C|nr:interferon epsilon-like [Gopherus evgoodei]